MCLFGAVVLVSYNEFFLTLALFSTSKSIVYRIFHMGDSTPSGSEDDQVRVENVIEGEDSFGNGESNKTLSQDRLDFKMNLFFNLFT